MVQFSAVISEILYSTYSKRNLNIEPEKSEQSVFAQIFLYKY